MKRIKFAAVFFIAAISTSAMAGPFGLEKGMTLAQIGGNPKDLGNGKYEIKTVPKPHSAFEAYVVKVGPSSGLCYIKGVGKNVSTNVYGVEIMAAYSDLKQKISNTYGKPGNDYNFLMTNSIWNEPQDWMMALVKNERTLAAIWEHGDGSTLPQDIRSIAMAASALNTNTAYLSLDYSFTNKDACDAEINKAEDSAL